ncbi:MAG: hypothetical protein HGB00_05755 [Chlorobiaceae bacterium]|nr:hypothetical protein [Chlorobiaceae bacterium]
MPVEIKELHIRVTVNAPSPSQSAGTRADAGNGNPAAGGDSGANREAMVSECVEQVLNVLQNKLER